MEEKMKHEYSNKCIICENRIVAELKICGNIVCELKYEDIEFCYAENTNDISKLILRNNDTLKLLWNISYNAIKSNRNRFRPFPNYFIKDVARKLYRRGELDDMINQVIINVEYEDVLSVFKYISINDIIKVSCNTDGELVMAFYQLMCGLTDWVEKPVCIIYEKAMKLYYLLRFIILSNKAQIETSLLEFAYTNHHNNKITSVLAIHKIIYDESTEENFGYSPDISWLYHGSNNHNWHSILRNGVKNCSHTKLMTAGAAYGNGTYMSDDLNLSYGYMYGGDLIAIMEVRGDIKKWKKGNKVFVINDESCYIVRYLMEVPSKLRGVLTNLDKCIAGILIKERIHRDTQLQMTNRKREPRIKMELKKFKGFHEHLNLNKKDVTIKYKNNKLTITYLFVGDLDKLVNFEMDQGVDNQILLNTILDKKVNVITSIYLPIRYPFDPPIVRIEYPRIQHNKVTYTGLIYLNTLFGNNWSPTTELFSLFSSVYQIVNESKIVSLDYYEIVENDYVKLYRASKHK